MIRPDEDASGSASAEARRQSGEGEKEESSSFLKKRTKKLLFFRAFFLAGVTERGMQKFFASFFVTAQVSVAWSCLMWIVTASRGWRSQRRDGRIALCRSFEEKIEPRRHEAHEVGHEGAVYRTDPSQDSRMLTQGMLFVKSFVSLAPSWSNLLPFFKGG